MRIRIGDDDEIHPAEGITLRCSGEYEQTGDRFFPVWLEVTIEGHDGPNLFRRIEVRDGRPEIVAMGWWSRPGQREVMQKDLRNARVASFLDELYPAFVLRIDPKAKKVIPAVGSQEMAARGEDPPAFYAARKFVDQLRSGPEHRAITPELLKSVADVYRRNIHHAPTQAVARTFGVKSRMASTYVDRARQAGYLPKTKQGKKMA
ncbi:hypothetical protein [Mycobacterium sp. UM_CSW]|uniref:hypothetical protein n=1 Tax=Mycobacterium sp. UM_CSW TaxID=1370119 RepID=UPI0003FA89A6|nr:hypothetical protein [Mycobacterium sp. UM_CSW]